MGKRKSLVDPTARKRQKVGAAEEPTVVSTDLWARDAPSFERPRNKQHSEKKNAMIERTSQARKMRSIPESAQSYNPDKAAHERAVQEAAAILMKREAEHKMVADKVRIDPAVRKAVGDDLTAPAWEEEVQGEPRPDDRVAKRKTRQQRNKSRKLVLEGKLRRMEKARRKVVNDVDRIDAIKEEMAAEAREAAEKQKKKKLLRLKKILNPRIGRRRFKPTAIDIQTEDEIKPSLRSQGKITAAMRAPLKIRYEAFQARNVVPASAPLVRRPPRRPAKYFLVTKTA